MNEHSAGSVVLPEAKIETVTVVSGAMDRSSGAGADAERVQQRGHAQETRDRHHGQPGCRDDEPGAVTSAAKLV